MNAMNPKSAPHAWNGSLDRRSSSPAPVVEEYCDKDIRACHDERVRLTESQKKKLRDRRDANRERLRRGLKKNGDPAPVKSAIQGSYAMETVIQEPKDAYDIDDGVVFTAKSLTGPRGTPKTALDARERLVEAFPTLTLDTSATPTTVTGTPWLDSGFGFSVDLRIPGDYPEGIPQLVVRPEEIPWHVDRHAVTTGVACLRVSSEHRFHWPRGSDLTGFMKCFVVPYFARQAYCQTHGQWPDGQERPHGAAGIFESFSETLTELRSPGVATIERFLIMLASPGHPKGNDPCPCGSGKKIRKGHRRLVRTLRNRIDPRTAAPSEPVSPP